MKGLIVNRRSRVGRWRKDAARTEKGCWVEKGWRVEQGCSKDGERMDGGERMDYVARIKRGL